MTDPTQMPEPRPEVDPKALDHAIKWAQDAQRIGRPYYTPVGVMDTLIAAGAALLEARDEAERLRDALALTLSSLSWCAGYISSDPATTPGTVLDAITAGRAALSPKAPTDD